MPRSIFVALWSRETETKTLNSTLGARTYYLDQALASARKAFQQTRGDYSGQIHAIFLAPEYLFTKPRNPEDNVTRAVEEPEKMMLVSHLKEASKSFPEALMIPGTIIYRLDEAKYPVSFAKSRHNALEQMRSIRSGIPQNKSPEVKNLGTLGVLTLQQKIELLESPNSIGYIVRNKMFAFLNGAIVAKYGKKADLFEAKGDVPGVFIPGKEAGIQELDSLRFGFEICYDHNIGVLKNLSGRGAPVDVQVILSAEVPNAAGSMFLRAGGFSAHASSKTANSRIFVKPRTGLATDETDRLRVGGEEIDGDPLEFYLCAVN